ncbi:hypothetical protein V494_08314 [Pseudogymnoascus sp. VKM F-4513 (FW-928)]|nr:hypothetical protein V494_08314 [Pseudogymnoascus sp. VKM F-4513 (FW-928)]
MLAARDQENLVHGQQALAASKPLNQGTRGAPPKTPGNRYPKTPIKIPLHDENAPTGFGKKSVLQTKGKGNENLMTGGKKGTGLDKNAFITPMGPRTRAPLGMKTTNAKTKAFQTPAGPEMDKGPEKTQIKPTSTRPLRQKISHADTVKLEIHGDEPDPLGEREVEYCPPKPKDLPYENEDFPNGYLDFSIVKKENQRKDFHTRYYNPVDANGVSKREREFEEELARSLKATDEKILKAVEEDPCVVHDVPETFPKVRGKKPVEDRRAVSTQLPPKPTAMSSRGPGTLTSRRAASALAMAPKPTTTSSKSSRPLPLTKKPAPFLLRGSNPPPAIQPSTMRNASAVAASRSTMGYKKGRSASTALSGGTVSAAPSGPVRSFSNLSAGSDKTMTPARYGAKRQEESRLDFLGAFDINDDDLGFGPDSGLPECLRGGADEEEEEFVMTLN